MSGGGEFETPPPSPNYSPQPSDDEGDEENASVASDGPGWWEQEPFEQREIERQERCIYLANRAHIELIHALPEDICPTLTAVLEYTEWVSLGEWHLVESDEHVQMRIVEHFRLGSQNNN